MWGALAAACLVGIPQLMAAGPKAVVIVTDASDADTFRRIGSQLIDVEVLLQKKVGIDYEVCNRRVRELRDFRYLFYREDVECSADRFWRQRLAAANPKGETLRLTTSRVRSDIERSVDRAIAVHKLLSEKFPEQRNQLNANLNSELQRLHPKFPSFYLAARN